MGSEPGTAEAVETIVISVEAAQRQGIIDTEPHGWWHIEFDLPKLVSVKVIRTMKG